MPVYFPIRVIWVGFLNHYIQFRDYIAVAVVRSQFYMIRWDVAVGNMVDQWCSVPKECTGGLSELKRL